MDRDARLKQFAGALFSHVYREYNTTFDLPVKLPHVFTHHAAADCSDEEGKAVLKLCLSMRNVFNGVFVRNFESFQRSTQHFMTFLTSRCLKLCGDDVFLSFMMICAFIAELNLFCLINGCFAFMNTAPKCLQAIFNRKLKKEFYANGGWESLRYFSEHFAVSNGCASEEVVSQELLDTIKERLDEDSSEEESDSSSDEEEDVEEDEEDDIADPQIDAHPGSAANQVASGSDSAVQIDPSNGASHQIGSNSGSPNQVGSPVVAAAIEMDSDDSDSSSETEMDSDESEEDSDEDSDDEVVMGQENGIDKSGDSEDEEDSLEEGEIKVKANGLKHSDDSDSSEESDPSSMSEEDSESEAAVQTNCIKPEVQNLNVDKKGSLT